MKRLSRALWDLKRTSSTKISRPLSTYIQSKSSYRESRDFLFASPWSATQLRGAKSRGADVSYPLYDFDFNVLAIGI